MITEEEYLKAKKIVEEYEEQNNDPLDDDYDFDISYHNDDDYDEETLWLNRTCDALVNISDCILGMEQNGSCNNKNE